MTHQRVFLVILRRPRNASDKRSDPFWEFGSFGITGCHVQNLMNPRKSERLEGARLAFAQGGPQGTRLVYLTPPVHVVSHRNRIETTWTPQEMPLRYIEAPILVHNSKQSDFPQLANAIKGGARSTIEGQFASRFRSCTTPLDVRIADELIRNYIALRNTVLACKIAVSYTDALPPRRAPLVDRNRHQTYGGLLAEADSSDFAQVLRFAYCANAKRNRTLNRVLAPMDCPMPCSSVSRRSRKVRT